MWITRTGWVAAEAAEVVGTGLHVPSLARWFEPFGAVTDADVDHLVTGTAGRASLRAVAGAAAVPVRWRVTRRVRDTVHLDVTDDGGHQLAVRLSFSPWDGGTAVELEVDGHRIGGHRLRRRAMARRLERSIAALEAQVLGHVPVLVPRRLPATAPLARPAQR